MIRGLLAGAVLMGCVAVSANENSHKARVRLTFVPSMVTEDEPKGTQRRRCARYKSKEDASDSRFLYASAKNDVAVDLE